MILRSNERPDIITNVHSPSCEQPSSFFCILAELEFGRQILAKKIVHIKFNKSPSSENTVVSLGQTDRHESVYSRFPQFFERA